MTKLCTVRFGASPTPVVATLGDPLASTCSVEFAKTWLAPEGGTILGYDSFEAAAAAVTAGEAEYLVVPAAYPSLAGLIFDDALEAHDQFRDQLPAIVLVASEAADPAVPPQRLYHHPAVTSEAAELLRGMGFDDRG
ncbi:hypothetical protein ACE2AJ_09875 [Aquihabitans daechungensis]|uniref:hypothetical protein n=1 Tax=Aquihabitans daechungensis TaxID=1052257 RepID=UPI003BA13458